MPEANDDGSRRREGVRTGSAAASAASLDELTREIDRLRASDAEWGRLHQTVIEERAAGLREIATLKRTRDDLHAANDRYLQEARDARRAAPALTEALQQAILIRSLADNTTAANWADKRLYISQACDCILTVLHPRPLAREEE